MIEFPSVAFDIPKISFGEISDRSPASESNTDVILTSEKRVSSISVILTLEKIDTGSWSCV